MVREVRREGGVVEEVAETNLKTCQFVSGGPDQGMRTGSSYMSAPWLVKSEACLTAASCEYLSTDYMVDETKGRAAVEGCMYPSNCLAGQSKACLPVAGGRLLSITLPPGWLGNCTASGAPKSSDGLRSMCTCNKVGYMCACNTLYVECVNL